MASIRTSVELIPDGCRLVEAHVSAAGRRTAGGDVRVRTFVTNVPGSEDPVVLATVLGQIRQDRKLTREAWVTIWGLRSTQQLLRLPPAKPADLEAIAAREARKDIAPLEMDGDGATLAILVGSDAHVGSNRRSEVSLVAVSNAEVRRRIQPLVDAGFVIAGVVTPALALTALARITREVQKGATAAYVAIGARAICLAIVRDGVLLFAREMAWGHATGDRRPGVPGGPGTGDRGSGTGGQGSQPVHTGIEARLASEIKRSILFFKQTFRAPVEALVLCGDMPHLRSLTAPLGESLGIAVLTLDSLVGIDAAAVPEPADQFRADVSALRLAIAIASDPAPVANLLPADIRKGREARTEAIRLAAAVAVGLLLTFGWYSVVRQAAANRLAEVVELEQQLAMLEPEAARVGELRQAHALATRRQAALVAFDSQGPRLARVLEALSQATPDDVVVTLIDVQAQGTDWLTTITGVATTPDAASGQAAINALLRDMSESPFVGAPAEPPSLRVVSGTGGLSAGSGGPSTPLPDGLSGVEFSVQFQVAK